MARFEDHTRQERVQLILDDWPAYRCLLRAEHWYLILDGLARSKPHIPGPQTSEQKWRSLLRQWGID